MQQVVVLERQLDAAALGDGAVSGADDLQLALIALRHTGDEVGDERAGEAVQRPHAALLDRALAPQRDQRFSTAQAFASALDDYALSERLMASQLRLGAFLGERAQMMGARTEPKRH